MTNVLILTASVGNGHTQVALNLQHKLTAANCNVNTVDFLQASSYDLNNLFYCLILLSFPAIRLLHY